MLDCLHKLDRSESSKILIFKDLSKFYCLFKVYHALFTVFNVEWEPWTMQNLFTFEAIGTYSSCLVSLSNCMYVLCYIDTDYHALLSNDCIPPYTLPQFSERKSHIYTIATSLYSIQQCIYLVVPGPGLLRDLTNGCTLSSNDCAHHVTLH